MQKALALTISLTLVAAPALAQNKEEQRLHDCGTVLKEILDIPDNIPQDLLDRAECVIVIPSTKKGAFGVGGSYGRGAMSCRSGENFQGPWGAPSLYALEGVNIGFQLGGEAIDYVLLIMNKRGANSVLKSKTKLGGDASATAGPKGRTATAATDAFFRSEILSYSRTRGLFAGISLEGSTLRPDNSANKKIYKKNLSARQIVLGGTGVPAAGQRMVSFLNQRSPRNLSEDK